MKVSIVQGNGGNIVSQVNEWTKYGLILLVWLLSSELHPEWQDDTYRGRPLSKDEGHIRHYQGLKMFPLFPPLSFKG